MMLESFYRCEKCQCLKPEERAFRLEMRAKGGEIGRGGGYLQRSLLDDARKEWNSDDEEYDEFGRKKRKDAAALAVKNEAGERQKAALARLHQKGRGGRASRSRSPVAPRRGK